jgi:ABC-type lipoprotein release transport system permease subunit
MGKGRFGMTASGIFTVAGMVAHPLRKMNEQVVYLPLKTAQDLLSADGHITALLLWPKRKSDTETIARSIRRALAGDDLRVYTWREFLPEFLNFIRIDMASAYLMSLILYVVIGLGFLATVLTMTMERLKEFGVLLAIGMARYRLSVVVFLETLCISLTGVILGMLGAFLILCYFHWNPLQLKGNAAVAIIERGWDPVLPVSFAADLFYVQGMIVFLIAMVVFLYPLVKIRRLNILEAAKS